MSIAYDRAMIKATPTLVDRTLYFTSELFFATHRYSRDTT